MDDKQWDDYVTRNPNSFYGQMADDLDKQWWKNNYGNSPMVSPKPVSPPSPMLKSGNPASTTSWTLKDVVATIICGLFIWGGIATSENWIVGALVGFIIGILASMLLFFLFKLLGWLFRIAFILLGLYIGYLILSGLLS